MIANAELGPKDIKKLHKLEKDYNSREVELTEEQQEFIRTKLSSKLWRMDNLYKIRDKNAKLRTMKLNNAQRKVLTKYKHNKKIILKSRQQGISTLFLAYYIDDCLFKPGYQAGIQSYGQDEADKLSKRAEIMWDELSDDIKGLMGLTLVSNNSKGMTFSNGSILKIGNFRGDTLQGLHVSELGKIASKYPEKAKELKTGAFQAVSVKNRITIESTAEGRSGLFYEMWRIAEELALQEKALTPLDFQAIFLSWVYDSDCQLDFEVSIDKVMGNYFSEIEEDLDIVLTDSQKWWYAKKKEELGDEMTQEYPTTAEEAFMSAKDGSYYARMYREHIIKGKRLIQDLYDENLNVSVAMDLGMNDTMVLVWYQRWGKDLRIVDSYHNSGEGLEHYARIIHDKVKTHGYVYDTIYGPHDMNVRDLSARGGKSRKHIMRDYGIRVTVLPRMKVNDGIELVRKWIPHTYIDESLKYIQDTYMNYTKEWDNKLGVWKDKPRHDDWSNPADAIRYVCLAIQEAEVTHIGKRRPRKVSGFDI